MIPRRSALLAGLLAAAILWAPLPFASVTPRGELVLQVIAFLAFALAIGAAGRHNRLGTATGATIVLVALAALGLLQSVPLPVWLLGRISPGSEGYAAAASNLLGVDSLRHGISLAPQASRAASLDFLAWGAALYAGAVAGTHRSQRRVLVVAVVLAALFQVAYGAEHWFARSQHIWGEFVQGTPRRLRGTFVNPDHLSYLLGISLAIVFAGLVWAVHRARREIGLEWRLFWIAPWVLLWPLLFVGLAFTGSRGGMAAAVVAVVVQATVLAWSQRRWRLLSLGLLAALGGLGAVAWLGFHAGFGRWLELSPYDLTWNARLEVAQRSLALWRRFPVFGTGFGSFRTVFPLVEQQSQTVMSWWHAHNDFVELLTTGGVVGAVLLVAGLLMVMRRLLSVSADLSRRTETRAMALAAIGVLFTVGAHEMVDFGALLPATAFITAVILGAALGTSNGARSKEPTGSDQARSGGHRS